MAGPKGRNRELAALAIASGKEVKDAASTANVSERTLFNWLGQEPFRARVRELRSEMVSTALGRLSDGLTAAADALNELVKSQDADVKFKAAKAVIELSLKVREQTDLAERIAAIEHTLRGERDESGDASDECGKGDGEPPDEPDGGGGGSLPGGPDAPHG